MSKCILNYDIEQLESNKYIFSSLEGCSILVTGSTGLIGSTLIKTLLKNSNVLIYANCRSEKKFQEIFYEFDDTQIIPLYSDVEKLDISRYTFDYIIHGASITDSKAFIEKPVETIKTAINGTINLLEQCKSQTKCKGFVYLSSLEVYGTFDSQEIKDVKEFDSGYLNSMSVRSSYSESKRMVENICISYNSEYGVHTKIVRLCQTFGPGVAYSDNRVFAQFARSIIEKKDIVLKTNGETVRNYCYVTDAVLGILYVLVKGKSGEAYNVANKDTTLSIVDMAKLYCKLFPESGCDVVFDIAEDINKLGYNPTVKLSLNTDKIEELGWKPENSMEQSVIKLVRSLQEIYEHEKIKQ